MNAAAISQGSNIGSRQIFSHAIVTSFKADATPIVYVLDESAAVRESLALVILEEGWCCKAFASVSEFLASPLATVPSCLVLDAASCSDLLDVQRRIALDRPGTSVIVLAGIVDLTITVRAMKAGAIEFFTKPVPEQALRSSIQEALERSRSTLDREMEMRTLRVRYSALSRREREVMVLVASGMLNKQVGFELGISEITVKAHRGQTMQKMQATSLAHLVKMAVSLGLSDSSRS